jgi:citrate lyase subunit beta/citryl-CoA lyase
MVKSLQLQADLMQEFGSCVMDVTLDCEDGAVAGAERAQAMCVAALVTHAFDGKRAHDVPVRRVGVRLHAVDHAHFEADAEIVVGRVGHLLSYVMVPKVESLDDVGRALQVIDAYTNRALRGIFLPLHVLVESPAAVTQVQAIAAHPRVQSVSFGLMDFVSAHGGAIPSSAMGMRSATDSSTLDQFHHPLVLRAKLEISSACHAAGKVPSHCVVTEFKNSALLQEAARFAANALGYTRMWSIHPDQVRPILDAFAPSSGEVSEAAKIVGMASDSDWAPVAVDGKLHDRASYRYFWQVLERAHRTGRKIPESAEHWFQPVQQAMKETA